MEDPPALTSFAAGYLAAQLEGLTPHPTPNINKHLGLGRGDIEATGIFFDINKFPRHVY